MLRQVWGKSRLSRGHHLHLLKFVDLRETRFAPTMPRPQSHWREPPPQEFEYYKVTACMHVGATLPPTHRHHTNHVRLQDPSCCPGRGPVPVHIGRRTCIPLAAPFFFFFLASQVGTQLLAEHCGKGNVALNDALRQWSHCHGSVPSRREVPPRAGAHRALPARPFAVWFCAGVARGGRFGQNHGNI